VLASFAVGAGIIFESPKYSERIQRIAMLGVIAGVIVEAACTIMLFVFDEGISTSQQDKIVALETRLAFRALSDEQSEDVVALLKGTAGQHFDIVTYWKSPEAWAITQRIYATLEKAGWIYDKPATAEFILGVEVGVLIPFDKRSEPAVTAAKKLAYALTANHVYATEDPDVAHRAPPEGSPVDNKITISVGIKP